MAYVYKHIRLDTEQIFYIGIGSDKGRLYKRAYRKHNRSNHWHNIVNKASYRVEITHDNITWEEAMSIERYLISLYGRQDKGTGILVNLTDGGDGVLGIVTTAWNKGKSWSEESKRKMSLARLGKPNPNKGKSLFTDEQRKQMSIDRKDKMPSTKGIKFTEERRLSNKYAKARRGVLQYDLNNNLIKEHYSLNDAAQETKIPKSSIYLGCINGREYRGFRWEYKNSLQTVSEAI